MSFGGRVTATKIELIKIRRSMQVAKMVHKILDDKREVLLKKIDEMIEEANKAREDIWTPLDEIYTSVYDAYMSLGTMTLESISDSTPSIMEVDVNIRRIVDVKIPTLKVETEKGRQQLSKQTRLSTRRPSSSRACSPAYARQQNTKMQYSALQKS
jgi:V/A-type H+-transporting ATPase subunit D